MRVTTLARLLPVLLAGARPALADGGGACAQPREIDKYQLLKRLSLDLRGRIPSYEEYVALDGGDDVPAAVIDEFVKSDDFRLQMRRYHDGMLWPNVGNVALHGVETALTTIGPALLIASQGRQQLYRAAQNAGCDDYEHVDFDPAYPGEFRPLNKGGKRDGWRLVTPYWAPATKVKMCAFDAQETQSVVVNGVRVTCNSAAGLGRRECGCGPGGRFCYAPGGLADQAILGGLREQLSRAVDEVSVGGKPYTELLLGMRTAENGPIAFWRKYLAPASSLGLTYNAPGKGEYVPDKEFTDATWTEYSREGQHAGILTSSAYLLRFQTNRGRANRFQNAFACDPFVPPAKAVGAPGCSMTAPDLTNRCVCQYCHVKLEPIAAHFAMFAEAGTANLADTAAYPRENPYCVGRPTGLCQRFYVTQTDAPRAGWLQQYQFADVHPEYNDNIEKGPKKLAAQLIQSGSFANCTVKRLFHHLVKRDLRLFGDQADELATLDELAKGFTANGYSLPWLVKQIVKLPQYRRVR